ncbi:MAG: HAD-IB family hydrolase [Spirochaetes bacterium]|nr:HAD-IB family hydrolase [Spirochaetota bacterium]
MSTYVAFFDLDHTIIASSSGTLIVKDLYKRNFISLFSLINGTFLSLFYKLGIISTQSLIHKWVHRLKGIESSALERYSEIFFEETIKHYIYPQALESMYMHKVNGASIVLLSASLDFICKPLKKYLHFDDVLCTELEVNNGYYTGLLKGNYCYGKEKLNRALAYCTSHSFDIKSAYYYADSVADIPMLEAVGFPQCVNPQPALLRLARSKGWTVHNW